MLKQILTILSFLILWFSTACAQEPSGYELRKINANSLELMDQYERRCKVFKNKEEEEEFFDLFQSNKTPIANDVLPDNNLNKQISPKTYADKMTKYFLGGGYQFEYNSKLSIKHLSPIRFNSDDTSGELTILAQKIIDATHKKYQTHYKDTILYDFNIAFNGIDDEYKFTEIIIHEPQGKYCIIEAYRKPLFGKDLMEDRKVLLNGDTTKLNKDGRYFLKDVKDPLEIKSIDEKIYETKKIKPDYIGEKDHKEKDKNVAEIAFKEPYWYWQVEAGIVPFYLAPVNANSSEYEISTNGKEKMNFNLGASAGLILFQNNWSSYALSLGINYASYRYKLTSPQYRSQYKKQDPDQKGSDRYYTRIIEISEIEEQHEMEFLNFPVKANGKFEIYNDHYLNIGIGWRYYNTLRGNYNLSAKGTYSGRYPNLYNIKISDNEVYDEFGTYSDLESSNSLKLKENFYSWDANLGWQYKLNRRSFFKLGINYVFGSPKIFDAQKKKLSRNNNRVNSLTNITNEFYLESWSINVGFRMNM